MKTEDREREKIHKMAQIHSSDFEGRGLRSVSSLNGVFKFNGACTSPRKTNGNVSLHPKFKRGLLTMCANDCAQSKGLGTSKNLYQLRRHQFFTYVQNCT